MPVSAERQESTVQTTWNCSAEQFVALHCTAAMRQQLCHEVHIEWLASVNGWH